MKRICFGAMFNIIYQARVSGQNPKVTNDSLCAALFSVFGDDFSYCGSTSNHMKNGHDNVPLSLQNAASIMSFEYADSKCQQYIVPLIKDEMKEALVRAIKDILEDDTSINSYDIVGYIDGYQKEKIIQKSTFSFSAIIVSLLYYAITKVDNHSCSSGIKEINTDFIKSRIQDSRPIYFEDSSAARFLPLEITINDPTFNQVFENVYDSFIFGIGNHTNISIFTADINNKKINFRKTKQFVLDNLGTYVMSREKINRTNKVGKALTTGIQSLQKFIVSSNKSKETVLGETFLYVFLEQVLGAPKILSKLEIDDIATKSKSDGVHLYRLERRGIPYNQLLFGASNIYGDIKVAVDCVFDKVQQIEQNYDEEFLVVDNTLTQNIFSPEINNYMENILKPQKNKTYTSSPDMAFGCFIGYTVNVSSTAIDNKIYENDMKTQMKADIDAVIPYIENQITSRNLKNYEFYFYVVPFNDATQERISIVDEMIGGI